MLGANVNQGVQASSGKVYRFGSSGWEKEYRKRVDDAITILFGGGVRRIYWVGRPIMPDSTCDRQMRLVNDIYSREAKKHSGVQYVDAYRVFSGSGGYSQYFRDAHGEMQQVRDGDGEHLTYAGGARLAEVVMAATEAEWLGKKKASAGSAAPSPKASAKATPAP